MELYLVFAYDSFQEEETPDRFVAMFETLEEAKSFVENRQRSTQWIEIVRLDSIKKTFSKVGSYLWDHHHGENFGKYYWKWSKDHPE